MRELIYPLLSGGIDSTLATFKKVSEMSSAEVKPIFINYGQFASEQEWKAVSNVTQWFARFFKGSKIVFHSPTRIDLKEDPKSTTGVFHWTESTLITGNRESDPYLENRNLILLSVVSSFVESKIGPNEDAIIVTGFRDEYTDTRRLFVEKLNDLQTYLLSEKKKHIVIETPVMKYGPYGKRRMVKDFKKYKDLIKLTWSCYVPKNGKPCRKCGACQNRKQALLKQVDEEL